MKTSVIIPTYNAEKYLPKLLEALEKQTTIFELIIIDSSSTDNTVAIAKEYTKHILTIPQVEFDHGGTRTIAAKVASEDIIVFLTQDALPYDDQAIEKILEAFENPKVGAAYGRQLPYEDATIFSKHLRYFNYPEISYVRTINDKKQYGIKTAFLSDSFAAYRKKSLKEAGWFKNDLIVGEDTYAGSKILLEGYALAYCADAKVYHSHSYGIIQEFKRYFDIGVFHKREKWILQEFGKAEGEGKRYIKSEFSYLLRCKAYHLIPNFFIRNGMKYFGYKLGQNYTKLPIVLIKKISMHYLWWNRAVLD